MNGFRVAVCLGLLGFWAGCGPAPRPKTPMVSVTGTLNLDGKPAAEGEVHFVMLGVPPSVLKVADGAFSGEAPVGDSKVEVYVYEEGPPNPRYPDDPPKINTISEKFWGPKTTLKATVEEGGSNEFEFDVTSK